MALSLTAAAFLLAYALLMLFYSKGWKRLPLFQPRELTEPPFLSVVIAARNEEANIPGLLRALRQQTYPSSRFEILLVDDFSTDATAQRASDAGLPNLHVLQPQADAAHSSKKKSIETAIHHAKGELIITTDADCLPPPRWLEAVSSFYLQKDASFIAAPVRFNSNGSILHIFQSLDFMMLQGITAASVALDFHTMCNGANLAYRRQSFLDAGGFGGIDKVATGDDMLLMHKIRKRDPSRVFYLKSKEAIMPTAPMPDWKSFFMQRRRWASKTLVYDDYRIIAVLGFLLLLNLLFPVLLAASLIQPAFWITTLCFVLGKAAIELFFLYPVAVFYGERRLLPYLFLLQPLHLLYTVVTGISSQFGRYEWKGRKTK